MATILALLGGGWSAVWGWQASDALAEPEVASSMDAGPRQLCGNDRVEASEQCDGDWNLPSCSRLDPMLVDGTVTCDPQTCTYDTSGCELYTEPFCGNGVVDGSEECDPKVPKKDWQPCNVLGLSGLEKSTSCSWRTCRWNRFLCQIPGKSTCGNGIAELDEECDGDDFHGMTCDHLVVPAFPALTGGGVYPHRGGTLKCSASCYFDTRYCTSWRGDTCGDGVRNNNEKCDGDDVGGASCRDVQHAFGTVSCKESCEVDYSKCYGPCVPSGGRLSMPCSFW